ncbi:IS30 family transposase [Nocardioides dongkuii]
MPHGVLVPREVRREFWSLVRAGLSPGQAGMALGASKDAGNLWFRQAGGVKPTLVKPGPRVRRPLTLQDRESIGLLRAGGAGVREIARELGRDPGVVSRELARNTTKSGGYRPLGAQQRTEARARRPKTAKLARPGPLRDFVVAKLGDDWSPRQIANVLAVEHPEDPERRVCAETIYQSIYIQSRGALKRDLAAHLRRSRAQRRPQNRPEERRGKLVGTISISQRPAEAADRAVPGHWEGDLIMGRENGSAIGTLVERTTRFVLLIHLPGRHTASEFHDAIVPTLNTLPVALRRSLTWDNGKEMAMHRQITMATDMAIYFADPRSPWQRGSNENTNGLLRQYFPKGVSLRQYGPADLSEAARRLNSRPRETLGWRTPGQALNQLLSEPFKMPGVA